MKKLVRNILAAAFLFGTTLASQATVIVYDVQNVVGDTWEYTYTVSNDTLGVDIEEFSIFYVLGLTENLAATAEPGGWDPLVLQPDPLLPDDGLYDALAFFTTGIAPGSTLGGFKVQFDFLDVGMPGNQFFEILDRSTFAQIDSGDTQLGNAGSMPVSEPASLWLMSLGLLLFGAVTWIKRRPRSMINFRGQYT